MMVKVCGITRREDAEVAVEAGASAIGFIFYPKSPRYVVPEKARELGDGLDVLKVGVFVDETAASIESVMRAANLDVAQIYGGSAPGGSRVWRAFRLPVEFTLGEVESVMAIEESGVAAVSEAILLDGRANGETFDWEVARGVPGNVIIAGGLDASNVAEAIRVAKPWGVDASSRLESSPGIKDHEKMKQFIKAARQAS
jgi:phosphoribosylanthranilate isomerase